MLLLVALLLITAKALGVISLSWNLIILCELVMLFVSVFEIMFVIRKINTIK
ncbi:hypothetical protein ACYRFS_02330 [Listeria kieliensis]